MRVALPFGAHFQTRVGDPDARAAAERLRRRGCRRDRSPTSAWSLAFASSIDSAGAPAVAVADVAADVRRQREHAGAVAARVAARKAASAPDLDAELDVLVDRRQPAQLQAVVAVLRAEHRLVGERAVDEVPGVRVLRVEIADAREEASRLQRQAVAERRRLHVRLLDRDAVVGADRDVGGAAQPRIDARREAELGFGEAEAARARPDLGVRRQRKAADARRAPDRATCACTGPRGSARSMG